MTTPADLLRKQLALVDAGTPCATVQIVRVNGSIPNELGARMLVTAPPSGPRSDGDGDIDPDLEPAPATLVAGTVGGGRIEFEALKLATLALREERSRLVTAKLTELEAGGIGMMCGGQADLFIEVHLPEARLVLCGAGHINVALARMAKGLGWRITVIDDRPEWCSRELYPDLDPERGDLVVARPELVLPRLGLDARSFVIVGTRENDTEAILAAARTRARYIGVVASRRKAIRIARELARRDEPGFSVEDLAPRLHGPVGLDLGGRSPEAVALSILAEVQALRHGRDASALRVPAGELLRHALKETT